MTVTDEALREVALNRQEYNQIFELLGREPTPVELGMFGAMWSEHCGYKNSRPLLKQFPTTGARVLQGPGENAGVVDIGDNLAVAFKIESHNHPSAIEPYQGAATGVGGIVRDIFTMGARPVALLNSLRFGPLTEERNRFLLSGVVGGIGGYGNCLGIPTVAGDIFFDEAYNGNPLVNAMCAGIVQADSIMRARASGPGNLVIVVGADTGRDGIHGATFASVENPEESHRGVIQVGNPFLEKLLLEACLELLEADIVVAMQDLGAAGLTSSIVESASSGGVGIEIDVDLVSRRETGMNAYEVMLSESQERMLVIAEAEHLDDILEIFERWELHSDVIGRITDDGFIRVLQGEDVVANVPASNFVDDCPTYVRDGIESDRVIAARNADINLIPDVTPDQVEILLKRLLSSPNICSRESVVRTYDHTIMTNTVLPPLEGDAAVLRVKGTGKGVALKTDCNPRYVYLDPFEGGKHAVAEAARNVACTGARPIAMTNCLNFGSPEDPGVYYQMQQAIRGMALAAEALNTPVVSGNVSLYNQTNDGAILPTPTVGMVGLIERVSDRVGFSAAPETQLYLLGPKSATLGASEYLARIWSRTEGQPPMLDLYVESNIQETLIQLTEQHLIQAAHDTSEGGLLIALVEMLFAGETGAKLNLQEIVAENDDRLDRALFGEAGSRVIIAIHPSDVSPALDMLDSREIEYTRLGEVTGTEISIAGLPAIDLVSARQSWREGLE